MRALIIVTYRNEYSAVESMNTLRQLKAGWVVEIYGAVALAREAGGELHMQDSYSVPGDGALLGRPLTDGLTRTPLTGGLSAAVAAGTVAHGVAAGAAAGAGTAVTPGQEEAGSLPERIVGELSAMIPVGGSAVLALIESHDPEQVAEYFRGTGGRITGANLTPDQQERIQRILDAGT